MLINGKAATCMEKGYTGDTHCVYCDKMLQRGTVIAALGHDYKNEVTTEPTTTSTGVRTYTCKRCGYSYTETIAKLPDTPPASEKPGEDPSVTEVKKGDVDGDGKVTLLDAQLTLKAALKITSLKEEQRRAADVNGDKQVNLLDAQLILKIALKIITIESLGS